jgi:hypothetical protein
MKASPPLLTTYAFSASIQFDAVAIWTPFQNLRKYIVLIRSVSSANSQIQQYNCFDNERLIDLLCKVKN